MRAGDLASREAVRVVRESLEQALRSSGADPRAALDGAIRQANDVVYALARGAKPQAPPDEAPTESLAGGDTGEAGELIEASAAPGMMGTTCVAGVVQGDQLFLAHVGDSRAYLLRAGRLQRLTRDHSFVEERVRAGDLTEDEARRSRFRNMITRAVGIEAAIEPEVRAETLAPGDTLLVCTDGLTTMLSDVEIEAVLGKRKGDAVEAASRALIDQANQRGGTDNISLVLVHRPSDSGNTNDLVTSSSAPSTTDDEPPGCRAAAT
jgi:protein phosphatase